MSFHRVQQGIGIETLAQDERHAEPQKGEHRKKPAGVNHRQGQGGHLVFIEIQVFVRCRNFR